MSWRRRYPFWWRDWEEMVNELEGTFQAFSPGRMLPAGGIGDRMLPAFRGEFRVDVREHEDEVLIVADLPGVDKESVSLKLVNPRTLEISSERNSEKEDKSEGYYVRERMFGSMSRVVTLPNEVTDENAKATFKNGVLEVRLKKVTMERGATIPIE